MFEEAAPAVRSTGDAHRALERVPQHAAIPKPHVGPMISQKSRKYGTAINPMPIKKMA